MNDNRSGRDVPHSAFGGYAQGGVKWTTNRDDWIMRMQFEKAEARRREYLDSIPRLRRKAGVSLRVDKSVSWRARYG
jgi:hypothetical protein